MDHGEDPPQGAPDRASQGGGLSGENVGGRLVSDHQNTVPRETAAAGKVLDVTAIGPEAASLTEYFAVLEDPSLALTLADVRGFSKSFYVPNLAIVSVVAPQLSLAMKLRGQPISDDEFYRRAAGLRDEIKAAMGSPAKHLAIRRIQDIFRESADRLYHWADDRSVPADNNVAERDLRPSVIARKVSFGSVTDAGAKTRSVLTTVAATRKKRGGDVAKAVTDALNVLARNPKAGPFEILFPSSHSP